MRKQRAPDMTDERIGQVVEQLDGWRGKLTWDLLIAKVHEKSGITYSRFTLAEHPRIAHAFGLRKEAQRGLPSGGPRVPRDERVRAALEQAQRYRDKAERVEAENNLLLEQFNIWAINAERKGVTIDMLNAPLPKPSRDRSKGKE
jgi:hypothetical protein